MIEFNFKLYVEFNKQKRRCDLVIFKNLYLVYCGLLKIIMVLSISTFSRTNVISEGLCKAECKVL